MSATLAGVVGDGQGLPGFEQGLEVGEFLVRPAEVLGMFRLEVVPAVGQTAMWVV
ncbi:hypothetical protein ACVGVM_25670 [Pseudonocardia bannensis]|uniref:Uncharacterized protein n=1 Tax=Pseudonocardia bannensis TaxID=630973 RepID=A0A848DPR6_9PSEU|nr:hypothetical protein [Pseudonocardia bannensis]NMH94513.1 hypothetical protein [Pseudonocardia bannensis]